MKLLSADMAGELPHGRGCALIESDFPVGMAGGAGLKTFGEFPRDKVVVRDGIGSKVAEITPCKGLLLFVDGFFENRKADGPVVAMFFAFGEVFGDDHISGHIPVKISVWVGLEKLRKGGWKEREVVEDVRTKVDVRDRPVSKGICGKKQKQAKTTKGTYKPKGAEHGDQASVSLFRNNYRRVLREVKGERCCGWRGWSVVGCCIAGGHGRIMPCRFVQSFCEAPRTRWDRMWSRLWRASGRM